MTESNNLPAFKPSRWSDLPWGKSPFDLMEPDEVLRFAKAAYGALTSANCALGLAERPGSPFWAHNGTGGLALAEVDFALKMVDPDGEGSESIYRSYYRAAQPIIFALAKASDGLPVHAPWMFCDTCNDFTSSGDSARPVDVTCFRCKSQRRLMTLDDVEGYVAPDQEGGVS